MKTPKQVFDTLAPDSSVPRSDQYKLAWSYINSRDAKDPARINAKVWLTYRAIGGQVKWRDWEEKVAVVPLRAEHGVKWAVSDLSAQAFLYALRSDDISAFLAPASRLNDYMTPQRLADTPGSILNILRVKAMEAYWFHLHQHECEAFDPVATVNSTVAVWQNVMGSFDWINHPHRWREMRSDWRPLMTLMHFADLEALPPNNCFHPRSFIENDIWGRCMKKLREDAGHVV